MFVGIIVGSLPDVGKRVGEGEDGESVKVMVGRTVGKLLAVVGDSVGEDDRASDKLIVSYNTWNLSIEISRIDSNY